MTITFADVTFTELQYFDSAVKPNYGGLYLILFRPNHKLKPDSYRILYVGMANDLSVREISQLNPAYNCWKKNSKENILYISFNKTSNKPLRKANEEKVIRKYNPVCNKK